MKLVRDGVENAEFLSPMVFMIVFGTVFLNATTAIFFSKKLGVYLKNSEDILIVGISKLSNQIAIYLEKIGKKVILIDSNKSKVKEAKIIGLNAMSSDIYSNKLLNDLELSEVGYLFALTGNQEIDKYAIRKFKSQFGENGDFRIHRNDEINSSDISGNPLIFGVEDLLWVEAINKDFHVAENKVLNIEELNDKISSVRKEKNKIPLFIRNENNQLNFLNDLSEVKKNFEKNLYLAVLEEKTN